MVKQVRRILLKHPKDAFVDQATTNFQSSELNYSSTPDFDVACKEYDQFWILSDHLVQKFIFYLPLTHLLIQYTRMTLV